MKIIGVAIKDPTGRVWSLPAPSRHHHVIREMSDNGVSASDCLREDQGFVVEDGTFLTRTEACELALSTGQVEELQHPPYLYSEDLW